MSTITPVLFVAFSHVLTQSQTDGFKAQYSTDNEGSIVTLKEVAPELQAQMSNIPATESLIHIQVLAMSILTEATKVGATHLYCTGEPTLMMWTNLYGYNTNPYKRLICVQSTTERKSVEVVNPDGSVTKTTTFDHVQWREMF